METLGGTKYLFDVMRRYVSFSVCVSNGGRPTSIAYLCDMYATRHDVITLERYVCAKFVSLEIADSYYTNVKQ